MSIPFIIKEKTIISAITNFISYVFFAYSTNQNLFFNLSDIESHRIFSAFFTSSIDVTL